MRRVALLGTCLLLTVSGCGSDAPATRTGASPTLEEYAAVVGEHVGREPRRVEPWDVLTRELEVDAPGASLHLDRELSLRVAVAPTTDSPLVCADESFFDECVELGDDGSGGRVVLGWQELEPEEDPGVVYVVDRREGEDVVVAYSGVSITDDPRELDLGVSVDQLVAVATDERLTLA